MYPVSRPTSPHPQTGSLRHPLLSRPLRQWGLVWVLAFGLSPLTWAEDEIATDRPYFEESSAVVGKGRIQIETGFSQERSRGEDGRQTLSFTPTLLRLGLSEQWEFRLETDGHQRLSSQGPEQYRASGMGDVDLGLKWHMRDPDEAGSAPAIAWLFHAALPSGAQAFRGHGVRPSVRMVAEWELPRDWSVGVMPGLVWDASEAGERFTSGLLAVTAAKGWSDQFRTFVELSARQLAPQRLGGKVLTFDMGAAYLINRNAPDLELGMGLSVRY